MFSIYRFAVRNSSSSPFWSAITSHLIEKLPQLFDSYANPTDAQFDLDLYCIVANSKYKQLIRKSFSNQVNLFKTNYIQILLILESLILKNSISEARDILCDVLLKHLSDIPDLQPLLQMFIQIPSKIPVEQREEFTTKILSSLCHKLHELKGNKKLWPLFFDLAIVTLELYTCTAPSCAQWLIRKENFYPWKELGERLNKIIHLCANYDVFNGNEKSDLSKLDSLKDILSTIHDRAKVNNNLFHDIHPLALAYTLRWASSPHQSDENKKKWPQYVYKMGEYMICLIDRRQITLDMYSQLLQKLYARLQSEDDNDECEWTERRFFIVSSFIHTTQFCIFSSYSVLLDILACTWKLSKRFHPRFIVHSILFFLPFLINHCRTKMDHHLLGRTFSLSFGGTYLTRW
jgi:hypothetical protein